MSPHYLQLHITYHYDKKTLIVFVNLYTQKIQCDFIVMFFLLATFATAELWVSFNGKESRGETLAEACEATGIKFQAVKTINVTDGVLPYSDIVNSEKVRITDTFPILKSFTVCGDAYIEGWTLSASAFAHSSTLSEIRISTIQIIAADAVVNMTELVVFEADDAIEIGDRAFMGLPQLAQVSFLNADHIGEQAFESCVSLPHIVVTNVKTVGKRAFAGSGLIRFRSKLLTALEDEVLAGCPHLNQVSVEKACTKIGLNVFADCPLLGGVCLATNAEIANKDTLLAHLPLVNFQLPTKHNDFKLSGDPHNRRLGYARKIEGYCPEGEYTVQEYTTEIDKEAFANCEELTTVIMPSTVRVVADNAFANCTSLDHIVIPPTTIVVGVGVFSGCITLKRVELQGSFLVLGANMFTKCDALEYVSLPATLRACELSFPSMTEVVITKTNGNCPNGTTVELVSGATSVGKGAYANCTALESVVIPNTFTRIENEAFLGCTNLSQATFSDNSSVDQVDALAFGDVALTEVVLPISVKTVGKGVFSGASKLRTIYVHEGFDVDRWKENLVYGCNAAVVVLETAMKTAKIISIVLGSICGASFIITAIAVLVCALRDQQKPPLATLPLLSANVG